MNTIRNFLYALIFLLTTALAALSAEATPSMKPEAAKSDSLINAISVSPYGTVAFENFDGKPTAGVGLDVGLNLSKTVQLVNFVESDDLTGNLVDRIGAGVQLTGKLGKWLRPFARMSVGYAFEDGAGLKADNVFLRPQFGSYLDIWQHKSWHASLTGSWALDVDTQGNTAQRIFGGLVIGTSF